MTSGHPRPPGDLPTGRPPATVVIPTHNRHEGLALLLDDLLHQEDLDVPVEVLVVDSSVGDSAAHVVARAAEAGLDVSYHLADNSAAAKRNAGARLATRDVVLFADDDMRLPPHWAAGHLAALAGRTDVLSCGSIDFPPEWVASSSYYRFKQEWHQHAPDPGHEVHLEPWRVVTMNLGISRALVTASGGWDEDFVRYGAEDLEWGHRITRDLDAVIVHAPGARAVHQEVRQDVAGFSRKLYQAAYHGHGLLLAKAPDSRRIPTLRVTEPGLARTPRERLLYLVISVLARPSLVRLLARLLRRLDPRPRAYHPLPYRVLYLLTTRWGVRDRCAGRPDRSGTIT